MQPEKNMKRVMTHEQCILFKERSRIETIWGVFKGAVPFRNESGKKPDWLFQALYIFYFGLVY